MVTRISRYLRMRTTLSVTDPGWMGSSSSENVVLSLSDAISLSLSTATLSERESALHRAMTVTAVANVSQRRSHDGHKCFSSLIIAT